MVESFSPGVMGQFGLGYERLAEVNPSLIMLSDARDLQQDPQIRFRRYFRELDHTVMGPTLYEGRQAELSRTPPVLSKAAPCLGEDSRLVLAELLGLRADEIDELISQGIVEQFEPEEP